MMLHKTFLTLGLVLATASGALAQTLTDAVKLRLNKEDGLYSKGETVRIWADVTGKTPGKLVFRMQEYGEGKAKWEKEFSLKDGENLLFEGSYDSATHYVCRLSTGKDSDLYSDEVVLAGFVVAPDDFKLGFTAPKDLESFWKKEIKEMRKEKMNPVVTKDKSDDKFIIQEVEINCVGPQPLRAYIAHPKDAQPHSLPIIINLHAAGRPGGPSTAGAARSYAAYGALGMDLNAHGMLNDQPKEYYEELNNGELKGYSSREPLDKEDYYFKWMFLRAQRAVDYLVQDPLWDGKHIIVTGTSQGGGQSCFLAAYDPRITAAVLTVPAMLDQGAKLQGRRNSWPSTMSKYEESTLKNSPYFDPAIMMKNTKADIWCEIGLYDLTCPAPNLFATLNTVSTDKVIVTFQRPHKSKWGKSAHKSIDNLRVEYIKQAMKK